MNWKLEIKNWKLARRGFTIVELLVAMSLLVILLALSGMVFSTTVAAHRAAGATIDVSRNLRAVTNQLSADLRGLRKDAPVFIAFNAFDTDADSVPDAYYDTIHFFADGNFDTTRQYFYDNDLNGAVDDYNGDGNIDRTDRYQTIKGNVARIFYGHANTPGNVDYSNNNLLVRKSHLFTADSKLISVYVEIPAVTDVVMYTPFDTSFGLMIHPRHTYLDENELEFNTITLTNWTNALNFLDAGLDGIYGTTDDVPDNADHFINNCMTDAARPVTDLADIDTLHLLLSQGVMQMRIQWAYTADDLVVSNTFLGVRWWPSEDPDGNGNFTDSDFGPAGINRSQFGVYFTLPGGANVDIDGGGTNDWFAIQNCKTLVSYSFKDTFYPKALKFTFVLRDSNGIFTDGKTFTHIIYIDN